MARSRGPARGSSGVAEAEARARAALSGIRVLLVEDNDINQQVAREILGSVGISVSMATNGQEAVEAVAAGAYDAVLMDVQMPVMDGYEATRRIRQNPRFQALPIIAMTAHAMAGDREKSLAAGMNDHVTKPIDPEALFRTLEQHMAKPGVRVPGPPAPPIAEPPGVADTPPPPGRHRYRPGGQAFAGQPDSLCQYPQEIREGFPGRSRDFQNMARGGQEPDAAMLAHTLKGAAGNIGAGVEVPRPRP